MPPDPVDDFPSPQLNPEEKNRRVMAEAEPFISSGSR